MDSKRLTSTDPDARVLAKDRTGGTLLEVIVALIVLSFGMLGMATTTAVVVRQTTLSEIRTQRVAVAQRAAERLRSMPFTSLDNGSSDMGEYAVSWTVTASSFRAARIDIVTEGPMHGTGDLRSGATSPIPPDTFSYTVVR